MQKVKLVCVEIFEFANLHVKIDNIFRSWATHETEVKKTQGIKASPAATVSQEKKNRTYSFKETLVLHGFDGILSFQPVLKFDRT